MGRVLDLFAGLGGWSRAFRERGHEVLTLDLDPAFGCDYQESILDWDPSTLPWKPDVILASPPCEKFSTLGFQNAYFQTNYGVTIPRRTEAFEAMDFVKATMKVIQKLQPELWVVENPRALLRKLRLIPVTPQTVWYCHVGHPFAKPTDLWSNLQLPLPGACHNRRPSHTQDCCCHDHVAAPRGSFTGTQGKQTAAARAEVPLGLSQLVCEFAEAVL